MKNNYCKGKINTTFTDNLNSYEFPFDPEMTVGQMKNICLTKIKFTTIKK